MADNTTHSSSPTGISAPVLLLITGSLLALSIIVSRLAADEGAPMLWFLTLITGTAGLLLLATAVLRGQAKGNWYRVLAFSIGAGALQALPNALGYLSVAHVGASFVSLAFAFPLLLTYVLALAVGMERFAPQRALGVAVALSGGLLLVLAKFKGLGNTGDAVGWVLAASAIPLIIAGGNLYRSRFWPQGAQPLLLAALMLLIAAALIAPFAVMFEGGTGAVLLLQNETMVLLAGVGIAAAALQFVAYFRLQQTAGPVYLSQIGSVAAAIGTPVAVLFLGEALPDNFVIAATLVIAGALLFQLKPKLSGVLRQQTEASAECR